MAEKGRNSTVIRNRKARHEYQIETVYTAGMVLTGTEVKSLRGGKASLQEAYCYVNKGELFIKNMNIKEYENGSYNNHDPKRERKLLLKKKEIAKIQRALEAKGYTLVPLSVYFNERNLAKIDIGLGKGKKFYDKRHDIKDKDTKRELDRVMKRY
jgi:SsrA-binding protein